MRLRLTQKVSELEGRIYVLYRIREDEKTLDSILSFCPAPEMGVSVPCVVSAPTQSRNPWDERGAKPRALANSTSLPEPWIEPGNRRGRRSSRVPLPSRHIKPTNRFAVLDEEEFPYLDGRSSSFMVHSTASVGQRSHMVAPRSLKPDFPSARARSGLIHPPSADHLVRDHSPAPPASLSEPSLRPLGPSSLVIGDSIIYSLVIGDSIIYSLVIGDSIIRNVRDKTAVTICFPGAKVGDLIESIPSLLVKHPLARNIIIHIGCNDISNRNLET
ncbi:hypothetical protein NHX12_005985 [Muraenolepis orangiensis]|uniref:SGNH hydrolase-type esterase domain-containing protein n=1 Tax=Muraenolepis orangiensis TaxID=630683 RepID=A0A9Q0IE67_9TELE|nr:hypothetical protein NHX12_005985 [Muraenolepis orangiensis]